MSGVRLMNARYAALADDSEHGYCRHCMRPVTYNKRLSAMAHSAPACNAFRVACIAAESLADARASSFVPLHRAAN